MENRKVSTEQTTGGREEELRSDLETVYEEGAVAANAPADTEMPSTAWDITATQRQRQLFIKQGTRIRHPDQVLNQFATIVGDTGKSTKQKYLNVFRNETERATMPEVYKYRAKDDGMIVEQLGVADVARQSYERAMAPSNNRMNKLYSNNI